MSVHVPDVVVRAALDRAAADPSSVGGADGAAWGDVIRWAAARPPDPVPVRAARLRGTLGLPAGPDSGAFEAAGRALRDGTAPAELERLCLSWHRDDVRAAAPLLALFAGHGPEAATSPDEQVDEVTRGALQDWMAARLDPTLRLTGLRVLSGGYSRRMLAAAWESASGPGRAVVRIEQDGMFGTDGAREAAVMAILVEAGYPAPAVLREEPDPGVIGHPFFVMEHVDGAPAHGEASLDDVLRSTADLHRLPRTVVSRVAALDGVERLAPQDVVRAHLERLHRTYRSCVPQAIPLLEKAFGWLEPRLRATGPSVVVHGDAGPGNAMHDGSRVTAVVDWEFAHAGDAAEEWAYLALVRGRRLMPPREWKDRLRDVVGVAYDEDTWRVWETYVNVKGACVNLTALEVFRESARPAPRHLTIGVAVHLRFLDRVVDLIGARS